MLLSPNVRREERVQRLQRRRDVRHGRGTAAGGLESFSIWNSMILRLLGRLAPLLCYIQEYISNWKTLEAAWLISTNKLSSDPALYMQTPPLQGCWNREGQGGQSRPLPPLCVEMGVNADISWESRCSIEINVWAHFYKILLVFKVPYWPWVKGKTGKS